MTVNLCSQSGFLPSFGWSRLDSFELDTLGKREAFTEIPGNGALAHVQLPGIASGLATTASLLLSTECKTNFLERNKKKKNNVK